VMALLPIGTAHEAAEALREQYRATFPPEARATISAGLVYAHDRVPLRQVLQTAHHLLDDVAKDENGRDSVAVAVMGASGERLTWATTWDFASGESSARTPLTAMIGIAERLRHADRQLTSKFVYGLRDRLAVLADRDGALGPALRDDVAALVLGELRRSLARRDIDDADAITIADDIALTGRPRRRVQADDRSWYLDADRSRLDVTPLLIARFLTLNLFDDAPDPQRAARVGGAA
jgi:CRISPR-associated protein Cmr2